VDGVGRAIEATLCSRNAHKARELERLLPGWTIATLDADDYPDEAGTTYHENALGKAAFGHARTGGWTIGEDSGIEVAALDGRPGIGSARYASEGAPAIEKLLAELDGVEDRRARYVSELVAIAPGGEVFRGGGVVEGSIASEARGTGGFGYDPVFVPDDRDDGRTMAELDQAEKDAISHRGRAARALLEWLGADGRGPGTAASEG
jgi:XTP/dITP diphosphohydrolase